MTVSNYRQLKAWQISMNLVEDVYRICLDFPKSEMYGLGSQIQRAEVYRNLSKLA